MAKILIVEDEVDLAELISSWLSRHGHDTETFNNGDDALLELRQYKNIYDLLILDVRVPGKSGLDLCKLYRQEGGLAPIMVITAQDSLDMMEKAFTLGADDYIGKPFHLKELKLRTEGLLRRGHLPDTKSFHIGDIELDTALRQVKKNGQIVHLSPKEYSLLELFLKHPHHIFSAEEILRRIWESDIDTMNATVRGHINRLRKKLDKPDGESIISNIYGVGYKLNS